MAANDLTTLPNLKTWLFVSSVVPDTDDALLTGLISRVSTTLQKAIGRNLSAADYVQKSDGLGAPQSRIFVANTPINSVASLTIRGIGEINLSADGIAPGYMIDGAGDSIILIGYTVPKGFGVISLAYNGGFAAIPDDAEQACLDACAFMYSRRGRQGLVSQALPNGGQTNFATRLPADILESVMRYQVVVLA